MSAMPFRPSPFTVPAEPTAHGDTEHLSVSQVLDRVPRIDGSDPTRRPGDPSDWFDDTAPGQIGQRQRETRLLERPEWHEVGAPAEVAERWSALLELAARADDLRDTWLSSKADEKAEKREVEAEMAAALRAGRPAEDVETALTDWPRRRLALAAEHRVVVAEMATVRHAYDEAVASLQETWRDSLVAAIGPAHQRARELVGPALAAVAEWQATVQAAHTVAEVLNRDLAYPFFDDRAGERVVAGKRAPGALADLMASDDPRVTGQYLAVPDDGVTPHLWERELMASDGYGGGWRELSWIEAEEKYTVTEHTKPGQRGRMPTAPFVRDNGHVV